MLRNISPIIFMLFIAVSGTAQTRNQQPLLNLVLDKRITVNSPNPTLPGESLEKGAAIQVVGMRRSASGNIAELIINTDKGMFISGRTLMNNASMTTDQPDEKSIWYYHYFKSQGFREFGKNGLDKANRQDLDGEYGSLSQQLEIYEDSFLEDYLDVLILDLFPGGFDDFFPATLQAVLYKGLIPNVFTASNGKIYISTGMIASLKSEEELKALLAIEIAHLFLDHPIINYRSNLRSQKRADFWAGVATIAAATLESYAYDRSYRSGTLTPIDMAFAGNFTRNVSYLSYGLAAQMAERLGLEYKEDQKTEALQLAQAILQNQSIPAETFEVLAHRIDKYFSLLAPHKKIGDEENKYKYTLSANGSTGQSAQTLQLTSESSAEYLRRTQILNLFVAFQEYYDRNYTYAQSIVDQYLNGNHALLEYYYLNALLTRKTSKSENDIKQSLTKLKSAVTKATFVPIEIKKEIAVLLLRLNQEGEALDALHEYRIALRDNPGLDPEGKEQWWSEQMIEMLNNNQ